MGMFVTQLVTAHMLPFGNCPDVTILEHNWNISYHLVTAKMLPFLEHNWSRCYHLVTAQMLPFVEHNWNRCYQLVTFVAW